MLLRIDPLSPTPVFEQIVFQVKAAAARGLLAPGDKLPSVRDLARTLAVNPNTVVRALEALERDRVIVRRQGAGCFLSPPSSDLNAKARRAQLEALVERTVTEAYHLGFSAADVRAALARALERTRMRTGATPAKRTTS